MEIKATKVDGANAKIEGKIPQSEIDKKSEKIAKQLSKTLDIPGFRKGKVPVAIVKQRYGDKIAQDAETEALKEAIDKGFEELGIKQEDMLGEPLFTKYEKEEGFIEFAIEVGVRPQIELEGYEELIPEVEEPQVSDEEVQERLKSLADSTAQYVENPQKEEAQKGDMVVIDFQGELEDGTPIEGGSAENFELVLGSGQLIAGFEDQIVGMKKGETKSIEVTFPQDYASEKLAGKKAKFTVTLKAIKEKEDVAIDDELAKKLLPGKKDANLEMLKEEVKKEIKSEKLAKLYNEELKPQLLERLVEKIEFDLPKNIVDQEIQVQLNSKVATMTQKEIDELKENKEKLEALKEEIRPDAEQSVKATFIVDALAKAEGVEVSDEEVVQAIYYEALQTGRNPQEILQAYQKQGLLPAIKMAMIEDKLLTHLLEKKRKKEEE